MPHLGIDTRPFDSDPTPMPRAFPLADALQRLGEELRRAMELAAQDGKPDLFTLKDATLELGLTWETTAEGGIEWGVVKLGGSVTRTNAHTITLNLTPIGEIHPALAE